MPPMPGQSRSLLQFDGVNNDIADLNDFHGQEALVETTVETVPGSPGMTMAQVGPDAKIEIKIEEDRGVMGGSERGAQPPYSDHDYTYSYKFTGGQQPQVKAEVGSAWIEEDAPPMVSPDTFILRAPRGDSDSCHPPAADSHRPGQNRSWLPGSGPVLTLATGPLATAWCMTLHCQYKTLSS